MTQIAEKKADALANDAWPLASQRRNELLSLTATLEARDAAFGAMSKEIWDEAVEAVEACAREIDDRSGFSQAHFYAKAIRDFVKRPISAIAQAEKVK